VGLGMQVGVFDLGAQSLKIERMRKMLEKGGKRGMNLLAVGRMQPGFLLVVGEFLVSGQSVTYFYCRSNLLHIFIDLTEATRTFLTSSSFREACAWRNVPSQCSCQQHHPI
jgi:hypothetical protein